MQKRLLFIDIAAQKDVERRAILVEVKGTRSIPSPVDFLANAVGKYMLYRATLNLTRNPTPLYMAVPITLYNGILSEDVGRELTRQIGLRLIVFDSNTEEIVEWTA